ncbi:MAG TPA: reverse transcriptase domain-containing protein, partial [Acidimicrobiia bacterium]|nr:reverse transcriptase domain-containing protein [Acidimicrobiia bacterium]
MRWAVDRACRSFACGTGLGWDALHPRALLRCSDDLISLLIQIMLLCEASGEWPAAVALVVIVLLPKPDGGFRPIGLLPLLPRLWMRARREVATEWERVNKRPYLYAGEAMGAHVAVWKQAARAELAAVVGTDYALVLLDLVKAFERVPHDVVLREAKKLGYPMWLLRLSFATYRLGRVLRVGNVVSTVVVAARGITAGSGFATTELRIMMIDIVDAALKVYPTVSPTLYVDDLGMESCGGPAHILRNLVGFVTMVCRRLVEDRLELSKTKCKLTASTDKVGAMVAIPLSGYGITYERRVKALGAGLGGGRRRHMGVVAARLQAFQRRGSRYRALRRAGVNTARLLRTGGTSAMCYGIAIQGVSPYMLLRQRRAASAASAPGSGLCGQNLDLALVLADGSATGRADPAYTAHSDPIGQWATAAWEQWIPAGAMLRLAAAALVKLAKARNPWHCCTGPGAGFVATAARLGWTIHDAFSVTTDDGTPLRLLVDPPVVVMRASDQSVRRWRWRNIEAAIPSLAAGSSGAGPDMAPLWRLLNSREETNRWSSQLRGALRSLIANRQWTQERGFRAGWFEHSKCMLCLHSAAVQMEGPDPTKAAVDYCTPQAPVGTLGHRAWRCRSLQAMREEFAPEDLRLAANSSNTDGQASFDRALFPSRLGSLPTRLVGETFEWVVRPADDHFLGTVYPDGSLLDGNAVPAAGRLGWAFAVIDAEGALVASAHGRPPVWITDTAGAEAWAILQACSFASPGCSYRIDCRPCVDAIHKGKQWATAAQRPLARVFNLVFGVIDDTPPGDFVWMPAHTSVADIGELRLSNGVVLTARDRDTNDIADGLAKSAAGAQRVPPALIVAITDQATTVTHTAMWLARATFAANNHEDPPHRDAEVSRAKAIERNNASVGPARRRRAAQEARPPALGGHTLVQTDGGMACRVCRHQSARGHRFAAERCPGSRATLWAALAQRAADVDRIDGGGHRRMLSGDLLWCNTCGAYAGGSKAVGLAAPCPGAPPKENGGRYAQLRKLQRGIHPRDGARLVEAIPENPEEDGLGKGIYTQLA